MLLDLGAFMRNEEPKEMVGPSILYAFIVVGTKGGDYGKGAKIYGKMKKGKKYFNMVCSYRICLVSAPCP